MALGFSRSQAERIVNHMGAEEKTRALSDDKFLHDFAARALDGVKAKKIFKDSECKNLRQHGILDYVDNSWILTKKAKSTLLMRFL